MIEWVSKILGACLSVYSIIYCKLSSPSAAFNLGSELFYHKEKFE